MDRSKWEYKKLGDICTSINAGGTPSRGNAAYWNGNIPWVKIKDMNSKYVSTTEEFITEEGLVLLIIALLTNKPLLTYLHYEAMNPRNSLCRKHFLNKLEGCYLPFVITM